MGVTLASAGGGFNSSTPWSLMRQSAVGTIIGQAAYANAQALQPGIPTDSDPDPLTQLFPEVLAFLAALRSPARFVEVINLARKAAIFSGHPALDVPFYTAYVTSAEVERFLHHLKELAIAQQIAERSPIEQASLYARQRFGFSTQAELDELYFLALRNIDRRRAMETFTRLLEDVAREFTQRGVELHPDAVFGSRLEAAQQRLRAFEIGLERRGQLASLRNLRDEALMAATLEFLDLASSLLFNPPAAPGLPAMPVRSVDP